MQKFLSFPVTNEQNQLVAIQNIVLIEQASTTSVTISYEGGQVVTVVHATAGAGDETQRDAIQNAVIASLSQAWNSPSYVIGQDSNFSLPYAASAITSAFNTASFEPITQVAISEDTVLTAGQSGATILLDAVGEDVTLPANSLIWKFKFLATADVITTSWNIIAATADTMEGSVTVDGAAVPVASADSVNIVFSAATQGDFVEVECDGTNVYVNGVGEAAGSITATG